MTIRLLRVLLSGLVLSLILSGCTHEKYLSKRADDVELPKKIGLSASATPQIQGMREQRTSDSRYTIEQSTPLQATSAPAQSDASVMSPGSKDLAPATVTAQFAVFEVESDESSSSATFKAQLFSSIAPRTVENFERKANSKFYDGLTFHRVEDWVVQGGDPKGDGTGGGVMRTELNKQPFIAGTLGMARGNDIASTNDSQFFIVLRQVYGLDEQYTNFGQLIEGSETVTRIKKGDRIKSLRVL